MKNTQNDGGNAEGMLGRFAVEARKGLANRNKKGSRFMIFCNKPIPIRTLPPRKGIQLPQHYPHPCLTPSSAVIPLSFI